MSELNDAEKLIIELAKEQAEDKQVEGKKDSNPEPGYYNLHSPDSDEPVLARGYYNPDAKCFGFGYNIADGGGFLPLWDLRDDCEYKPVEIKELGKE